MALPDSLVIGAYKSGTTSLHHHLRGHPEVFVPARKEPNFFAFDGNPSTSRLAATSVTDRRAYEALFDGARPGQHLCEVSPEYLVNPWSPRRIRALVPEMRMVAVLRNPVDRAWSDFLMYVRDGVEPCTDIRAALREQDSRRAAGRPGGSYVVSGRYGEQLARYFELFDREQLHVVLFEDLVADGVATMAGIHRFIGVTEQEPAALEHANLSGVPRGPLTAKLLRGRHRVGPVMKRIAPAPVRRSLERMAAAGLRRPTMPDDVRTEIAAHFEEDVLHLEQLLGRDLSGVAVMRVVRALVVSHSSGLYGAQLHLLRLAPHLAERGVELTLASAPEEPLATAWRDAGHPHVPLTLPEHRPTAGADRTSRSPKQRLGEAAATLRSVPSIVRLARNADLLVSYSLTAHLEVALAGRLARRPVVLELVDMVSPGFGRGVLQLAARLATATVVNSAATAAALGSVTSGVHVVHPGVDLERFHPGPVDPALRAELGGVEGQPLVGIVGRVDPRKGVHIVVEAMSRLRPPVDGARLVVVGETVVGTPAFSTELRASAERLLGQRVRFVGRRSDVVEILRSLDVLVNASRAEPFGLSVLEAQATGVAVVAPRSGGIPEFVVDGVSGLLVPPFDPAALTTALQTLLADDDLRRRLADEGRRRAIEGFTLDRNYDRVAAVYRSVAGAIAGGVASRGRP